MKFEPYPAPQPAFLHLGLDDIDIAFFWLERSVELRSLGIYWIKVDPIGIQSAPTRGSSPYCKG